MRKMAAKHPNTEDPQEREVDKHEKIADLKAHLSDLQEKIAVLEGAHGQIESLYSWSAPARVHRKKSARWAVNLFLMVLIILVILLFVKQFILMAAVLALAFLVYVLDAVEPEDIDHEITTEGVTTAANSYLWEELYDFWFVDKGEWRVLHIDTLINYPRRLILLVKKSEMEKVKELMAKFLPFREKPYHSWLDRAGEALSDQVHHLIGS